MRPATYANRLREQRQQPEPEQRQHALIPRPRTCSRAMWIEATPLATPSTSFSASAATRRAQEAAFDNWLEIDGLQVHPPAGRGRTVVQRRAQGPLNSGGHAQGPERLRPEQVAQSYFGSYLGGLANPAGHGPFERRQCPVWRLHERRQPEEQFATPTRPTPCRRSGATATTRPTTTPIRTTWRRPSGDWQPLPAPSARTSSRGLRAIWPGSTRRPRTALVGGNTQPRMPWSATPTTP
jgi:hypothetical protein